MPKKTKKGQFQQHEAEQIEAYYRELSGSNTKKTKKNTLSKIVVILAVILSLCLAALGVLLFTSNGTPLFITDNMTLADGVTIAGVDVGGMTFDAATDAVSKIATAYSTQSMTVTVLNETVVIDPIVSGTKLDVEAAVRQAFRCGTSANPELVLDIVPFLNLNSDSLRTQVQQLSSRFPTEGIQSSCEVSGSKNEEILTVTIGTNYYDFDADTLYNMILDAYRNGLFTVDYTCNQLNITDIDLDAVYAEYCREAVPAVLDPQTHEVTESAAGYQFDLDAAKEALSAAQPGDVLKFAFQIVEPEMTTELLQSMLFRDELGTFTAYQSSTANRATNLKLACQSLDGIILNPCDTFSYNQALGERTPEKGYKPAASYFGSKTIQTYGGGICQPSSCLYYCALIADLEIVQRSCHGFISSYMPKGMDATVDWNGPDFKFRNNTDFPIRIDAKADGGSVTITLVGTDQKDYYVEMEYEVLGVTSPSVVEKEVDKNSGHKDGEVETTPYTGYTVQTYKLKYDKETDQLISREKEAYSVYSKRDKVIYVIKDSDDKDKVEQPTDPKPEGETKPDPKPEQETTPDSKPEQETTPESKPEQETTPESKPEQETTPESKPEQETTPESKPDSKPEQETSSSDE